MNQTDPLLIGIDWADSKHDYFLTAPDGTTHCGEFASTPNAIADQVKSWRIITPGAKVIVAIEATKGAIVNALLEYEDVEIRLVNPAALANFRKAFAHGGGKNDPTDAMLLATFLCKHLGKTRMLTRDSGTTQKLAAFAQDRRRLVDARADLANELTAMLKAYFPAALELKPARSYSSFFLKFLVKYPSLSAVKAAGKTKLRKFFHGTCRKRHAERDAELLCQAVPLTTDRATIEIAVMRVNAVVDQLETLSKQIRRYEAQMKQLLPKHERYDVARSLPHASTNTQARLIAAMGDDCGRYATSEELHAASGIAPLTTQSGRQRIVHSRWACNKFLRQTFHEYAGLSIRGSRWARAYYESQIAKGKSSNTAKRSLAYKWQRIIHRCWQTGEPYNEECYLERLKESGSPLWAKLAPVS